MAERRVAVVVGVGPGLGAAAARRFAREGFAVGLMARSPESLAPVQAEIARAGGVGLSIPADATEPRAVAGAFERVRRELGAPGVLVYNAGAFQIAGILDIEPEQLELAWRIDCLGALLAAQAVLPAMVQAKQGTLLFTGATASLRGAANFASLAVGKFGLRALAQSMAREFGPQGIHVAHVVIDGGIDGERLRSAIPQIAEQRGEDGLLGIDAIAEAYWHLHGQARSAWTHELDLRPYKETF